jgi:hypothetical protein
MKKLVIILSLVVVGLGAWLFLRPSAPRDISVSYLGTTNDTDIGMIAMFSVTNRSDQPVRFGISSLDFKTTDGWTPAGPDILGRYGDMVVARNARMVWRISEPKPGEVWRLTLSCVAGDGRHYSLVIPEITP